MTFCADLSGQRFNRWTVMRWFKAGQWLCRCDCGTERVVQGGALKFGRTRGCLDCRIPTNRTHGGNRTKLHKAWGAIIQRCENPQAAAFPDYGGRGIAVCQEWRASFSKFREWAMLAGYKDGLTIDRINNDEGYNPENCRWATVKQQARNRRSTHYIEWQGQRLALVSAAELAGIRADTLRHRLISGWPLERAMTQPTTR